MKSRSKALAPREAVIAKVKAAIARGDREEAICLALDNGPATSTRRSRGGHLPRAR